MRRAISPFFVFLTLFLFSCAIPAKYQDQVKAIDIHSVAGQEGSTRVLANAEEWRNSGVILKKGQEYKIVAKGRWRLGGL
jgi:hypothetical protein